MRPLRRVSSSGGLVAYGDSGSDDVVEKPQLPPRKKWWFLGMVGEAPRS
ncbi:hypothetical protein ACP4OV_006197 [Aristida adscensionis]